MRKKGRAAQHREETGHNVVYYEKWDAYGCHECNEWLETCCDDPKCSFCPKRPKTPLGDHVLTIEE